MYNVKLDVRGKLQERENMGWQFALRYIGFLAVALLFIISPALGQSTTKF